MNEPAHDMCGCCEGVTRLTPQPIANRPGLSALAYRVGTHAAFLQTMIARLSGIYLDIPRAQPKADGSLEFDPVFPLAGLTTRAADDPAIALLDAWAIVADVLTFYQERIANEGYLRTATERRSILELARLVGYALRPGVASTVYLAYTIDNNQQEPVEILPGARAQSVPGPGELPQSFETIEKLVARARWNNLRPRLTQPQTAATIRNDPNSSRSRIYLKGISTNLKPNDPLLIGFTANATPELFRVTDVLPDPLADRTLALVLPWGAPIPEVPIVEQPPDDDLSTVMSKLTLRGSIPPRNALQLPRSVEQSFGANPLSAGTGSQPIGKDLKVLSPDTSLQLIGAFQPDVARTLPAAVSSVTVTAESDVKVYALRVKASPFGYNAPMKPIRDSSGIIQDYEEWTLAGMETFTVRLFANDSESSIANLIRNAGDNESALQADISLQRGAESVTTQPIDINKDKINVTLGAFTFLIRLARGGGGIPFVALLTIAVDNAKRAIVFEPQENDAILISATEGDATVKQQVAPGGGASVSANQRTVTIQLRRDLRVSDAGPRAPDPLNIVDLDTQYDRIKPQSWAVVERIDQEGELSKLITPITNTQTTGRIDYGLPGTKVTRLTLRDNWLTTADRLLTVIRGTTVYAQGEELPLAEEPITIPICGGADDLIELDGLYAGLQSGRWLIVTGERDDIKDAAGQTVKGVKSSELVMLSEVIHAYKPGLPGDVTHTFIRLAKKLEYCFGRDKVTIYANVAKATHGETREETLGSGDGTKPLQAFTLRQPPLTFVAAPTPAGAESTLKVYVNNVEWHETDGLAGLGPTDRRFITRTDDDDKTTVIFGNGTRGARLPTGVENVKAIYRNGIGKPGNVRAEQISLLMTRPLGVKDVINPLRASGGADRESQDQARRNAPLALMALDRLVSVRDYADFARTFAGIGKALAQRLSDGRRELIFVTIAGAGNIPIDETSDLYRNLRLALRRYGDPDQPFQIVIRELLMLVISANVKLLPDYLWEPVAKAIRDQLLDSFSFERRELGQDVLLSEVISAIQAVEGVAYVDIDVLGGIPEKKAEGRTRRLLTPKEIVAAVQAMLPQAGQKLAPIQRVPVNLADFEGETLRPAQLAFLTPDVPDTLIINPV